MNREEKIEAVLCIRKLRGGSQPILVRASDGHFYVVKFLDNPQGPNLLFNEAIGTELYRQAGIKVPEWRPVYVSDELLDRSPDFWFETPEGRRRPCAGYCFGSRFVGLSNTTLFEILPARSFDRIKNRVDFWTAWAIDVFCGHSDNRQAIFAQDDRGQMEAYFMDHGHLFGGAFGVTSPNFRASRYLDGRVYALESSDLVESIGQMIGKIDMSELFALAASLPEGWCTEQALANLDSFSRRISDAVLMQNAIRFLLNTVERTEASHERERDEAGCGGGREPLCAALLPACAGNRTSLRRAYPVGSARGCGAPAVCAALPVAANF